MGMYIALNSCHVNHMPNGSQNEWDDFFSFNRYELEANGFIPVFWPLLYSRENIQFARYIDDYDVNNPETKTDRQECIEDYGDETYPYLIIGKEIAQTNLRNRRTGFLKYFGSEFEKDYDFFEQIISQKYQHYILLRTNGLALTKQSEQDFKDTLIHYENLEKPQELSENSYWQDIHTKMSHYDNNVYFFMGADVNDAPNIPKRKIQNTPSISRTKQKNIPNYIYWIFALINGIITFGMFFKTESMIYACISFIICSIITIILTSKYENS